ncbi:inorganic phosphate transporter [Enterovirga sp.]|uniref:inorganic phosphate transporter n=1 Tax=Enterovirga sp. TaxID=2026350 RepID=UPI002C9DDA3F|nr:inorganic phosphate transporter [Enterovirga sp.]HMO29895.1 inorganic phosphate transporter [Enterovirga sp.]
MDQVLTIGMLVSGLFFGWTIGSHYTGATMGMAYGSGLIRSRTLATVLIAVFVLIGATFDSSHVVSTVGTGIIRDQDLTPLGAMVMMLTAALVTAANTWMKWPVSTSQLACFSVVGAALAMHAPVFWGTTVALLFVTWIGTPLASGLFGFVLTGLVDRISGRYGGRAERGLRWLLLAASCYAAYTLGANNTGNAVGVFYGLHEMSQMQAGFVGGLVMALGALTWGRPTLEKVGTGLVELDLNMGVGAKLAQSITAHTAAWFGYPTSMNQALLGGMAGASGARGRKPMSWDAVREIVFSWFFTPVLAGIVSFGLYTVLSWLLGVR